jgi:hypothetical protein
METPRNARVRNPVSSGPSIVYHYTTMEGFLGIVGTRTLRATHLFFQNDASEFDAAREHARAALAAFALRSGPSKLRKELRSVLARLRRRSPARVHSFSFSRLGDDLNLWRTYARGGGAAIGLPRRELESHAAELGIRFGRCEYEMPRRRDWTADLVEAAVRAMREESAARPRAWTLVDEIEFQLDYQGSLVKNPTFRSEQEWRCVAFPDAMARPMPERFRTHGGRLVPYVEIRLPARKSFWRKARILLSPEASDELELRAVRRFLEVAVGTDVRVEASRVPLGRMAA